MELGWDLHFLPSRGLPETHLGEAQDGGGEYHHIHRLGGALPALVLL